MKIVINKCYGGFHPSVAAIRKYLERKGLGCFVYESTGREYVKVDDSRSSFATIFTEDMGERFMVRSSEHAPYFSMYDLDRTDPDLVAVVEELGDLANSDVSQLKVVEIPDGIEYTIEEYDGVEWIAEKHEVWG